ncbi:MAG: hypothetical protein JRC53_01010 [Deltaproteobacteria bacterium]|nr:hypothetical protein [Deltaproteobacteria bacterium]MBW2648390.1 hypothetical protein [Deltaproteobacteria bacterium]
MGTKQNPVILQTLSDAKILSEKIADTFAAPRFYREKKIEVGESLRLFENNPMATACMEIIATRANFSGHGLSHARKVAIDAGAIILIEGQHAMENDRVNRAVVLAHIAGILHDIKRSSKNHARRGAEEARKILRGFDLTDKEQVSVVDAIGNHEAFQPCASLAAPDAQLLSDALYDADKFRWGPDNFTEMIWDISDTLDISIEILLDHFPAGLKSLKKIRDTFRTSTGREYGPDFITLGLKIGEMLYKKLEKEHRRNSSPDCGGDRYERL